MPFSQKFNRNNPKTMTLLETIEHHDYEKKPTLELAFKTASTARYKRGLIYAAWRCKKREFKGQESSYIEPPKIRREKNVLIFKFDISSIEDGEFIII